MSGIHSKIVDHAKKFKNMALEEEKNQVNRTDSSVDVGVIRKGN
jgi:hypothetical protein